MSNARRPIIAAFVSASGGAGRTSTVANLAWVLSSAGKRVLVVDWGSEPPRVPEFLEPFYTDRVVLSDETGRLLATVYDSPSLGPPFYLERFDVPDTAGHIDVFAPVNPDGTGRVYGDDSPSDSGATELRSRLHNEPFDVVLIDAPTSETAAALSLIASVADVVAVCFAPRPRAIAHAGALARQLKQHVYRTDLVPVATMFDRRDPPRADRSRGLIRSAFTDLLEDQVPRVQGDPTIEIPYQPYEAFDPLLAVLVEEGAEEGIELDLLTQYGRLAEAITAGAVTRVPQVARGFQQRYRRSFGLSSTAEPDRVLVVYEPRDRAWADWVRSALGRAGAQTAFLREEPSWLDDAAVEVLVISSSKGPATGTSTTSAWLPDTLPGRAVCMLVELDAVPPEGVTRRLSVADLDESGARRRLLTHLRLIDRPEEPNAEPLRFPTKKPSVRSRPRRHPRFVGRDADLEELRDHVLRSRVTTLCGPAGIGKSELALEYTYRFTGDYDLIWWVPAHDRESVLVSLAQLAERLRDSESAEFQSTEYGTTTPLDELSSGVRYKSWLLVYDNVDDPEAIRGLVPDGGPGHVLVTSGDSANVTLPLGEMLVNDSVRLLVERVPGIEVDAAGQVAAEVGHLPLALQLAGSWLVEAVAGERRAGAPSDRDAAAWAVQTFLERMGDDEDHLGQDTVAGVVGVLVDALRGSAPGRNALLLAQLCSFLSTQGIDLRLIRSPAMIRTLVLVGGADAEPLGLDSWEVDRALWIGARFGLFRVDWGADSSLRIHRVVQKVLQDAMPVDERASRQAHVLSTLAAYAPVEVEESLPNRAARFTELQKHVFVSGALGSGDPQVRRWLVNQLRFLYTDGGIGISLASTEPGHALLAAWTEKFGPDDPLRNRLASQLANVERRLGNNAVALSLDDTALVHQRRSLALTHPQTLITARGRGGDLRGIGYFAEALDEDTATWEGHREIFGDDHPETRRAANNLAHSRYLAGDAAGALELELDNFTRLRRLLGADGKVTRWSQTKIGIFQRELGRYKEALETLQEAREKLQDINEGPDISELATQWQLAIAQRLGGNPKSAQVRTSRALNGFRELQGRHHPDTIACQLSFANDHRMVNDAAIAIELAREVVTAYRTQIRLPEDHPFLAIARLCLGAGLCAQNELEEAETEVLAAVDSLRDELGDAHPWTVAAVVSQARAYAALGRMAEARDLLTTAKEDCLNFFGGSHPATIIAAHNLEVAQGINAQVDAGWRDIHVDIPQT